MPPTVDKPRHPKELPNMTTKDATDRIVQQFAGKGVTLDAKKIEADITRFVKEFGMSLQEAERTVSSREARERNISFFEGQHKGSGVTDIASVKDKDWVTIEGVVTSLSKPGHKSVHQQGVISDRSGDIRFVVWARKKGTPPVPEMRIGTWYRVSSAVIDTYKDAPSMKIHSGTDVVEIPSHGDLKTKITAIKDLKPGIVNVKAKVQRFFENKSDKIHQVGVVGDETGTAKFTIWKSDNPTVKLQEGKSYLFTNAQCVDYKGNMNLVPSVDIEELTEDIKVKSSSATFRGNIVQIRPGSGLIKRCPVTGCGRTLSRQNYCSVHEIQKDFTYDLRIKAVLDDGEKARNIHIPAKIVEEAIEMPLKDAITASERNPLDDPVLIKIRQKFLFRYFDVEGIEFPDRLVITRITPVKPDIPSVKALLKEVA